jgi:hypothetical protein
VSRLKSSEAQLSGIGAWSLGVSVVTIIKLSTLIMKARSQKYANHYKRRLSRYRAVSLTSSNQPFNP